MKKSIGLCCLFAACEFASFSQGQTTADRVKTRTGTVDLPAPYATSSVRRTVRTIGWGASVPSVPPGFTVSVFASNLNNPRNIYQAPNGDIFIAQSSTRPRDIPATVGAANAAKAQNLGASANNVLIFRDANHDGQPELAQEFVGGQDRCFGMLALGNYFYVASTDALRRYPYQAGDISIVAKGEKILDLPRGGYNNHWTRNLIASPDGSKIFITVGSGSNAAEHGPDNEIRRADILRINPDGTGEQIYASGLRNPVGLAWEPVNHMLWTAVNERDELGDELVPDYFTSVREGGFYGWPFAYFGPHPDPRLNGQRPDLVAQTIVPDVPMGSHTASLCIAFYTGKAFPEKYRNGAFIAQHGSWNSSVLTGYKVVFVPFRNGKPSGPPEDFLGGFIANDASNEVHGRPVGVCVLQDGSMLVADDAANTIWRISYSGK